VSGWTPHKRRLNDQIDHASQRPLGTARVRTERICAPSLLPEWTRAHVLAPVARSADAHA
jgi:hypothetical protein